ncbi:MAG: hypothetical protein IT546_12785 [Caulobacteraceae bacterium]|nr:hypothetical protein [Caulobacteraceae bacterium]
MLVQGDPLLPSTLAGGPGDDQIIGGEANDTLSGGGGADQVEGRGGDDVLRGGAGDDLLLGGDGKDYLSGDQGDDLLDGGAGGDDYVDYRDATGGITVLLGVSGPQDVGGGQGMDALVGVEGVLGSSFNDTLIGDAGDNTLVGRGGDDFLNGAGGFDTVSYIRSQGGVTVSLADTLAQAVGLGEGLDRLLNIEALTGSRFDDRLIGDGGVNRLRGELGDDVLIGAGGDDRLDGGLGDDIAVFSGLDTDYAWTLLEDGAWQVRDLRGGSPDGTDWVLGVEQLQFANRTVRIAQAPTLPVITLEAQSRQAEGDGPTAFVVTIRRAGNLDVAVEFGYSVSGSSSNGASAQDFSGGVLPSGSLEFAVGETEKTLVFAIAGDTSAEADEGFVFTLAGGATSQTLNLTIVDDDGATPRDLTGTAQGELLVGGAGDDLLRGLGGGDELVGGRGVDAAVYAGQASDYAWWEAAPGQWMVEDLRPGAPDGVDTLTGVEQLQFSDVSITIIGATVEQQLAYAFENVLRRPASSPADAAFLAELEAAVNGGLSISDAFASIVQAADPTTAVASLAYAFFTGSTPNKGGLDYLVSPEGPNPNNINSAYYQSFNLENRYINFAVNLGAVGEGRESFEDAYGAGSLRDATRLAYSEVFGFAADEAKLDAILDTLVSSSGQTFTRAAYFAYYGGDGIDGLGTKAAMVGFLLAEAVKADVGAYAQASNAYLLDLADGAPFLVDLVGIYGPDADGFLTG